MDSFIDQDMEDDVAEYASAPGSAVKKRNRARGRALHAPIGAQPQAAIQPGAIPSGVAFGTDACDQKQLITRLGLAVAATCASDNTLSDTLHFDWLTTSSHQYDH